MRAHIATRVPDRVHDLGWNPAQGGEGSLRRQDPGE